MLSFRALYNAVVGNFANFYLLFRSVLFDIIVDGAGLICTEFIVVSYIFSLNVNSTTWFVFNLQSVAGVFYCFSFSGSAIVISKWFVMFEIENIDKIFVYFLSCVRNVSDNKQVIYV